MNTCTKSDLIHAFRKRNTKRRDLLFAYYRTWFDVPYTAEVLAQKISDDLGIHIAAQLIYHIRSKHKPGKAILVESEPPVIVRTQSQPSTDSRPAIVIPDLEKAASPLIQFLTT